MITPETSDIVNAIAIVESDCRNVAGDGGRAISIYQIHEAFWLDVYSFKVKHKIPLDIGVNWRDIGFDNATSRALATNTCAIGVEMIEEYLDTHSANATPENIYAAYTVGRKAFHVCGFNINDPGFPVFKRAKCRRVGELVRHANQFNLAHTD